MSVGNLGSELILVSLQVT